jgi:hypothetical protein
MVSVRGLPRQRCDIEIRLASNGRCPAIGARCRFSYESPGVVGAGFPGPAFRRGESPGC